MCGNGNKILMCNVCNEIILLMILLILIIMCNIINVVILILILIILINISNE